jgi:hypothetical protein
MSNTADTSYLSQGLPQSPPPRRRHRVRGTLILAGTLGTGIGIGAVSASPTAATHAVTRPAAVTTVPGPAVTVTVSPPAPAAGTVLLKDTGSGTRVTPSFTAGGSGDYIVSWSFSGNSDGFGGGSNFIMGEDGATDANALSLPNDIAVQGSGSTEIEGDAGAHTFNVRAADGSTWTVKVVSAP